MPRSTIFNKSWLDKNDKNGHSIRSWCEPHKSSKYKAYCIICKKSFLCNNQGLPQLVQHANGKSHKDITCPIASGSQTIIQHQQNIALDSSSGHNVNMDTPSKVPAIVPLYCVSQRDKAITAEVLWALKVIESNYSYSSCDGVKELFNAMFPGSVPENFSLGSSKISYLVSDAIGPYFHKNIINDLKASMSSYTIQYDETTNKQVSKQLDIKARYWSSMANEVRVSHLQTFLMGHATGKQLATKILGAIQDNGLPLTQLLMLGSDGPNVSKTVWNLVNEEVMKMDRPGLANVGTCNLHVFNNAFGKGLSDFSDIPEFVVDIHYWFKLSAVRIEDFVSIQDTLGLPKHKFLKHVECRWLSLLPALDRLIEQWNALQDYFIRFLPASDNTRYVRIKKTLLKKDTRAEIHFIKSIAELFSGFLTFFQREEPMIHLLHDKLLSFVKQLLMRFIKLDVIEKCKTEIDLADLKFDNPEIQLDNNALEVGDKTRQHMASLSVDGRKRMILGFRKFYKITANYLIMKLPLSNLLLKTCYVLKPEERRDSRTVGGVKNLAKLLGLDGKDLNINSLGDEWRVYQQSEDITYETNERIDHYWRRIFGIKNERGDVKYPSITKVIKVALVLSHGSADVERGFSLSGATITSSRVHLSEESINGILSAKSGLQPYGQNIHLVPITKELLFMSQSAHAHYTARREEEKKREEEKHQALKLKEAEELNKRNIMKGLTKTKDDLLEKEKIFLAQEIEHVAEMEVANVLLKEGNGKLKVAIKKKDYSEISLAQAMIEAAQAKIDHVHKELESNRKKQRGIQKRKQSVLESFFSKAAVPPAKKNKK